MSEDVRWQQRFESFNNAFQLFAEAVQKFPDLNVLEQEGLVKRFEFTFELAWKTMKDYLEKAGFNEVNSPRDVIKTAFQAGYIKDGQKWLDMLIARNKTSHQYDDAMFKILVKQITAEYYQEIRQVWQFLQEQL